MTRFIRNKPNILTSKKSDSSRRMEQNPHKMFLMSTTRVMKGGWVQQDSLPLGPNGRALCRWCSLEVPAGRRTFCSDFCVNEWKLRSDPGYLRDQVLQRDRGVCAMCRINCETEYVHLKRARGVARLNLWAKWGLKPGQRGSLWDADHIVPVVEGG